MNSGLGSATDEDAFWALLDRQALDIVPNQGHGVLMQAIEDQWNVIQTAVNNAPEAHRPVYQIDLDTLELYVNGSLNARANRHVRFWKFCLSTKLKRCGKFHIRQRSHTAPLLFLC